MINGERIAELSRERIDLVPYDTAWAARYAGLEAMLRDSLPPGSWSRIAHIGSTAVPGMTAKPIIDVQVEVPCLERVRQEVVPILTRLGWEFIWRPSMGERAPYYAWFILRAADGSRTAHIHMVEPDEATADRIRFRDILREHPDEARAYDRLKSELGQRFRHDRAAYTAGKSAFITDVLRRRAVR